ncbi:MAG: hypothetical protein KDA61_08830 [Planctomycetales bacterium]|nr:hypothetical protein [Planctomycetales bacterium]MCB1329185.1 hypothetical protein [Maritimibacter sp.]
MDSGDPLTFSKPPEPDGKYYCDLKAGLEGLDGRICVIGNGYVTALPA